MCQHENDVLHFGEELTAFIFLSHALLEFGDRSPIYESADQGCDAPKELSSGCEHRPAHTSEMRRAANSIRKCEKYWEK